MARRVLADSRELTLKMRWIYAAALYNANGAALDDFREAVTILEGIESTARRVLGGAHPLTTILEGDVRLMRLTLRARETPSPGSS